MKKTDQYADITLWDRFCLIWGGPRRWLVALLLPAYVARQSARREGECKNCGACCRMSWSCRHLGCEDGKASCKIYNDQRRLVCRVFPINNMDLADRNRVASSQPCGFSFKDKSPRRKVKRN